MLARAVVGSFSVVTAVVTGGMIITLIYVYKVSTSSRFKAFIFVNQASSKRFYILKIATAVSTYTYILPGLACNEVKVLRYNT